MDCFYVYETQEVGPSMRIPMQFSTREAAQEWIERRQHLPAFTDVTYEIRPDDPQGDLEQAKRFTDT